MVPVAVESCVDEPVIEHLVPREWTLVHIDAPLARKVTVRSERGNLAKIESILLQGTAPAP